MSTQPSPSNKAHRQPSSCDTSGDQRLQKYLAHAGVASRRRAEELITSGAVTVNGRVVDELGTRVNAATDEVRVLGKPVHLTTEFLYILLNKPPGAMSTVTDPQVRRTVLDLLPDEWRRHRIYPVGRLDYDTEGLLLLTNDGDLALHLTHPRYALPKRYHALLAAEPPTSVLKRLAEGIQLPGESRRTAPARVWTLHHQGDALWIAMEIHEGRNRQVRRMLEAVGYPPLRLRRVSVGPLGLGRLKVGDYRQLTTAEVASLRRAGAIQHVRPGRQAESAERPEGDR
jgi:23S rRNA pseudouridine2605 synthase